MLLCVEDFVLYSASLEHSGNKLRLLDRNSTNEDRLSFLVTFDYLLNNSGIFALFRAVDLIVVVNTDNGLVCRDRDNVEFVDLLELVLFGHSRTCHTREFLVKTEEILESDSSKSL